ncbi:hypothetical protein [Ruegeria sp. Alg231-54]|uniref:hypothetical protein n=1 Tax=Ruegeria sp. Alg231-54 TaxID=1922221 RepID=UPI000D55A3DE|nr:hypothetical protein [Ruegeria sp. Alg231-54]
MILLIIISAGIASVAFFAGQNLLGLNLEDARWLAAGAAFTYWALVAAMFVWTRPVIRKNSAEMRNQVRAKYQATIADLDDVRRSFEGPINELGFFTVTNAHGGDAKDILGEMTSAFSYFDNPINRAKDDGCYSEYVGGVVPALIDDIANASTYCELVPAVLIAKNFIAQAQRAHSTFADIQKGLLEQTILAAIFTELFPFTKRPITQNIRELRRVECRSYDAACRILQAVHDRCEEIFDANQKSLG